jgi:hypothetical protein
MRKNIKNGITPFFVNFFEKFRIFIPQNKKYLK